MRYKIPFVWNVENDYLEALNIIRVDGEPTIEFFCSIIFFFLGNEHSKNGFNAQTEHTNNKGEQ